MPANVGMDPVKLLFERSLQPQRNSNRTKNEMTTKQKSYKLCQCANVVSLQRGQIRKVECRHRSSNSKRIKIAERTNRERKTNDETINIKHQSRAYVCAYIVINEGNAFKLDSENADEIVKG